MLMEGKTAVKVTAGIVLLALVFGGAYWLGSRKPTVEEKASDNRQTPSNTIDKSVSEQSSDTKTAAQDTDASKNTLDEITDSITGDMTADQNALANEQSGETSLIDTESDLLNDLNESYDENEY